MRGFRASPRLGTATSGELGWAGFAIVAVVAVAVAYVGLARSESQRTSGCGAACNEPSGRHVGGRLLSDRRQGPGQLRRAGSTPAARVAAGSPAATKGDLNPERHVPSPRRRSWRRHANTRRGQVAAVSPSLPVHRWMAGFEFVGLRHGRTAVPPVDRDQGAARAGSRARWCCLESTATMTLRARFPQEEHTLECGDQSLHGIALNPRRTVSLPAQSSGSRDDRTAGHHQTTRRRTDG